MLNLENWNLATFGRLANQTMGDDMTDTNPIDDATDAHNEEKEKLHKKTVEDVQKAIKKAYDAGRKSLFDHVELGKSLVKAKNSLKDDFYDVINDEIINKKQVQRLIGLVIDAESQKNFTAGTKHDLKMDERIAKLDKDSFKDLKDPSMQKLKNIKGMEDKDWKLVMSGDDTPYYKEAPKPDYKAPSTAKSMTEEEYNTYKKRGTKKIIGELYTAEQDNDLLKRKLETALSHNRKYVLDVESKEHQIENHIAEIQRLKDQLMDVKVELRDRQPEAA